MAISLFSYGCKEASPHDASICNLIPTPGLSASNKLTSLSLGISFLLSRHKNPAPAVSERVVAEIPTISPRIRFVALPSSEEAPPEESEVEKPFSSSHSPSPSPISDQEEGEDLIEAQQAARKQWVMNGADLRKFHPKSVAGLE